MKRIFLCLSAALLFLPQTVFSQKILDKYVEEGMATNLNVQQLTADYEKAQWGLKEAKRLFGPNIDLVSSYTHVFRKPYTFDTDPNNPVAAGLIDFLNSLDVSNIKDGKIYYPTPNQYNAGLQLTQTVFNRELTYNKQIKEAQSQSTKAQLEDFKTELEAEIRAAYFQYLQAYYVKEVIKQGLDLANKNLSSVEKLIANQKVTKDVLYKAKSSVSNRETELRNAENNVKKSQYYFNFLLNRPFETTLDMDGAYVYEPSEKYSVRQVNESLSENEFRLSAIRYMQDAATAQKKFIHANYLPKIQLGALGAYNGQVISFDDPKRFIGQVQVSLKWNLFNSGTLKAKSKQADFQLEKLQSQYNLQQQQILLNETNAFGDVSTELQNHASIRDSYTNADVYYKAVEQKFQLGMSSILELTEAEAGLLQAGVQCQLWYYQLLVKAANYQKTTGKKIQIISQ